MSLATPERIQELQRKLYLKAKQEQQTSGRMSWGMSIPCGVFVRDVESRQPLPGACEPAYALRPNLIREPDAGDPHVRFDEREVETEYGAASEAPANERAGQQIGVA